MVAIQAVGDGTGQGTCGQSKLSSMGTMPTGRLSWHVLDRGVSSAAAELSHGEHRQLEIAMALATGPLMLLLDEPMAGLGPEASQRAVAMLRELKREYTILLVEHDMEAVFALADRITVLFEGRVLASGTPEVIRGDAEVRRAYLGDLEVVEGGGP